VDTDGRRLNSRALIINARRQPGGSASHEPGAAMTIAAYTVPSTCVPEAMGTYLLVAEGAGVWSVARGRADAAGGPAHELLTISARAPDAGTGVERISTWLEPLLPFAAGQLMVVGAIRDDDVPDPLDGKLLESVSWRAGGDGWKQVSRSPVWWIPDESPPWLGNANEYRVALNISRVVSPP
jgi:hypothetical protein